MAVGYAFGSGSPGQKHRDAPLSPKGKVFWGLVWFALALAFVLTIIWVWRS